MISALQIQDLHMLSHRYLLMGRVTLEKPRTVAPVIREFQISQDAGLPTR